MRAGRQSFKTDKNIMQAGRPAPRAYKGKSSGQKGGGSRADAKNFYIKQVTYITPT